MPNNLYFPCVLFSVHAMGRLLRKELLRVTIIQKVNENKKKAPQLKRSCSAFLYISILFVKNQFEIIFNSPKSYCK